MLRTVPKGTSVFLGTIAISTTSLPRRTNFTWLPLWLDSTNPANSSRRLISRKGRGLSRPNLNLDHTDLWGPSRTRRLIIKFECLPQVFQSFFFGLALTGNIHLKALGNKQIPFTPNRSCKRSFHVFILP